MTSILESAIAFIAPHCCIVCGEENNVLCDQCQQHLAIQEVGACILCGEVEQKLGICMVCQTASKLSWISVIGANEGVLRCLIQDFKFQRVRAAAKPLAALLADRLPSLPPSTLIVPVPTASRRIRQRGYDHIGLLAKELARMTGLQVAKPLGRLTQTRQVGASRRERLAQAQATYFVQQPTLCKGASILLVDDVITTGATMSTTARLSYDAGAQSVAAVAVVKQTAR